MGTPATTERSALEAEGYVTTWAGPVWIAASALGVQRVQLPDWHGVPPLSAASDQGRVVIETPGDAEEALRRPRQALKEIAILRASPYLHRSSDLQGPAFYRRVWAMVGSVPHGETRSYGRLPWPRALRRQAGRWAWPTAPIPWRHSCRATVSSAATALSLDMALTATQATAPDDGRCHSGR
jgi:hypothetical protein